MLLARHESQVTKLSSGGCSKAVPPESRFLAPAFVEGEGQHRSAAVSLAANAALELKCGALGFTIWQCNRQAAQPHLLHQIADPQI